MSRQRSGRREKRVVGTRVGPLGARVGPPPSFLERHWVYGLALALTVALVLLGLKILGFVQHWFM